MTEGQDGSKQPAVAERGDQIEAALTGLRYRLDALEAAKAAASEAKEGVYQTLAAACPTLTLRERVHLARKLYWGEPDLHPRRLAAALQFAHEYELRSYVGPVRSGSTCETCNTDLLRFARSAKIGPLCDTCQARATASSAEAYDGLRRARDAALATPVVVSPKAWPALLSIVVQHPPAVASTVNADDHLYEWRLAESLQATVDETTTSLPLGQADAVLRGAEAVASWYPSAVDAIVEAHLGSTTFTAVTAKVSSAISEAQRAADVERRRRNWPRVDVGQLTELRGVTPGLHPMELIASGAHLG